MQGENPEKVLKVLDLVSEMSYRWFKNEYFYSFIDKPYFQENELVETMHESGLPIELNRREWAIVRKSFNEQGSSAKTARQPGQRPRRLFSA